MTVLTAAPLRRPARDRALTADALRPVRAALRLAAARFAARQRLVRSITHLDDRLLADVGLKPQHRGFADRLIRRFAAGAIWDGLADGAPPKEI